MPKDKITYTRCEASKAKTLAESREAIGLEIHRIMPDRFSSDDARRLIQLLEQHFQTKE